MYARASIRHLPRLEQWFIGWGWGTPEDVRERSHTWGQQCFHSGAQVHQEIPWPVSLVSSPMGGCPGHEDL